MASQWGTKRLYTSVDEETNSVNLITCDRCHVQAVPRGINTTRKTVGGITNGSSCPNCGHIHRAGTQRDNQ